MPKRTAEVDWNAVRDEIRQILIQVAKARRVITYSELTAMLQTAYIHYHSHVLVQLLIDIGSEEVQAGRGILPALVVTKQTGLPGAGFFKIANERGYDLSDPATFWREAVEKVYEQWSDGNS